MGTRAPYTAGLLLVALALAACGGDGAPQTQAPAPTTDEARLEHVHGLGVDPDDETLYVATHYGLFQAPEGSAALTRVGDSTQDIMGFSVASGDRFIGSGHPDATQDLPPLLGLIESRDGGRTWKNVSLRGDADFHVLESAGDRVYGFNSAGGEMLVSADGGRTWEQRSPPGGLFSLAIDPRDTESVVASTEVGLFSSADAGSGWRALDDTVAGLLEWPAPDRLYLIDGQGAVARSSDGGRSWETAGSVGGQPVAFTSHESDLYAALGDGTVKRSRDGGVSWEVRAAP